MHAAFSTNLTLSDSIIKIINAEKYII
jgi:hypothetical protein